MTHFNKDLLAAFVVLAEVRHRPRSRRLSSGSISLPPKRKNKLLTGEGNTPKQKTNRVLG